MVSNALRRLSVLLSSVLLIGFAAVLTAPASSADPSDRYEFSAELDRPYSEPGIGPKLYETGAVSEADGPRLTAADYITGTGGAGWDGDIDVTLDPVAQTITVRADGVVGSFERISVLVEFDDLYTTESHQISNDLLQGAGGAPVAATIIHDNADEIEFVWDTGGVGDGPYEVSGVAVFSYTAITWDEIPRGQATVTVTSPCVDLGDDFSFGASWITVWYQHGFGGGGFRPGVLVDDSGLVLGPWRLAITAPGFQPVDEILEVTAAGPNDFIVPLVPEGMTLADCELIDDDPTDTTDPTDQGGGDDTNDDDGTDTDSTAASGPVTPTAASNATLPATGGPSSHLLVIATGLLFAGALLVGRAKFSRLA